MENIINDFFAKRYDYLTECSFNILKKIKRTDLATELVTECLFHIQSNQDKLEKQIKEGKLEAVCVRWMMMQVKWNSTTFKQNWIYSHKFESEMEFEKLEAYTLQEDDSKTEEELLEYELETQDKLNHIKQYIEHQPLDQRLLFDIIYNKGYNTSGKLSKYIGLSRTPSYRLMKTLKDNIKNAYKQ